jgi:lysophospholipase L1-like esterase
MKKKSLIALALVIIIVCSGFAAIYFLTSYHTVKVACVGDSLTQSTEYPYNLWNMLGNQTYSLRNFGAGSTTVLQASETPYVNTTVYQDALHFQPDIVLIMLGTNDAQPSLIPYNATFVADYIQIIQSFQALQNNPKIYVVLPPPIFSDQGGKMNSHYFQSNIIPNIIQAANQTGVPTIDVFSAMYGHPEYSTDGVHINPAGSKVIADTIYAAITSPR